MRSFWSICALTIVGAFASGEAYAQVLQSEGIASSDQVASSDRLDIGMKAVVTQICGAFSESSANIVVDFGDLADVSEGQSLPVRTVAADVAYICNEPNGFIRTVSSANAGRLVRIGSAGGAGNEIPYQIGGTGGDLTFALRQLDTPAVSNAVSPAFLMGAAGPLQLQISGVRASAVQNGVAATSVFAGSYVDTLTISVTAN